MRTKATSGRRAELRAIASRESFTMPVGQCVRDRNWAPRETEVAELLQSRLPRLERRRKATLAAADLLESCETCPLAAFVACRTRAEADSYTGVAAGGLYDRGVLIAEEKRLDGLDEMRKRDVVSPASDVRSDQPHQLKRDAL
ncbi:hypothetical protein [Rhodococcoides yunnanense]|uniref:hypothetical protein n=1 Tax=Rhodococcoides yunnanense TaxID=278209 RepID=UPI0022B0BB18|nr:hypothetical protein [Rhodococcus yunnanensis]MCZ4277771.1 hypothetical protein [Rhodococcus yunnanensis]